jgi:flagellar basal-body rod modification protein FlgD
MAAQMNPIGNQGMTGHAINGMLPGKGRDTIQPTGRNAETTSSSNSTSATISANDFLTLLVTEMKNQDPTANTNPNEYINQLVGVNSLQQLISINQTLMSDSSARTTGGSVKTAGMPQPSSSPEPPRLEGGNLTVPAGNSAAQRVAASLGAHTKSL